MEFEREEKKKRTEYLLGTTNVIELVERTREEGSRLELLDDGGRNERAVIIHSSSSTRRLNFGVGVY